MLYCDKCKSFTQRLVRINKCIQSKVVQYWELCPSCEWELNQFLSCASKDSEVVVKNPNPDIRELGNGWMEVVAESPFNKLFKKELK